MLYKRYKGRRLKTANDPDWSKGTWCLEKRINKVLVKKALTGARSWEEAQKLAAEHVRKVMENDGEPDFVIEQYIRTRLRRTTNRMSKYVYLVESRGYHKIGMSSNVTERFKQLSKDAVPSDCTLIMSVPVKNGRKAEKNLHERFAEYRVVGEWFRFPADVLEKVKHWMGVAEHDPQLFKRRS